MTAIDSQPTEKPEEGWTVGKSGIRGRTEAGEEEKRTHHFRNPRRELLAAGREACSAEPS